MATRIGVVSSFETAELDLPNLSPPALTPRQLEVAELIATGSSNAQIAANLGIGLKTVERHVTDILKRWRIDSRSAIATIMVSNRTRADSALNSN
ncbi:MAG: helix-turn-helix transcriptional regulator [Microbacteriaceae bacterium]|nr:helix-turn-helix transcriptional regulator [Microbacteriaceae bacterium]